MTQQLKIQHVFFIVITAAAAMVHKEVAFFQVCNNISSFILLFKSSKNHFCTRNVFKFSKYSQCTLTPGISKKENKPKIKKKANRSKTARCKANLTWHISGSYQESQGVVVLLSIMCPQSKGNLNTSDTQYRVQKMQIIFESLK